MTHRLLAHIMHHISIGDIWDKQTLLEQLPVDVHKKEQLSVGYDLIFSNTSYYFERYQKEQFLILTDPAYPYLLYHSYNPPALLFYQRDLSLLSTPSLAVIGSRQADAYAIDLAKYFIPQLVVHQMVIVSGLAKGIDTYAHQLTLLSQGKTIGVLGNGIHYYYPKANQDLQRYIGKYHLLLSEHSYDTAPKPYYFPLRNRIIASVTKGTFLLQAGKKVELLQRP